MNQLRQMHFAVRVAFANAMHADVEQIALETDCNGDLWVTRDGNVPYETIDCTTWDGTPS